MRFEISCKRFYIPEFDWTCPTCGLEHTADYYISYPVLDEPVEITGSCDHHDYDTYEYVDGFDEDSEWFEDVIATATVRVEIEPLELE